MYFDPLSPETPFLSGLVDWSRNRDIYREIRESDPETFTPNFLSEYERFKEAFEALL